MTIVIVITIPPTITIEEEESPVDESFEDPEDKIFCPVCLNTPCEWLNWEDVMEMYIRQVDHMDLPPNQKRFSCY